MPVPFFATSIIRPFVLSPIRRVFVNSSSRATSLAIWAVNFGCGETEKRWCRICSDILSFFTWDIGGMLWLRSQGLKVIRFRERVIYLIS